MQPPPISQADIESRIAAYLDELLTLWQTEQGLSKPRDLELMASVIPFQRDDPLRVLDLCCGPGDVGRAIRRAYTNARIDGVDRDPFLTALCRGINQRDRVPGRIVVRDLNDAGWNAAVAADYDVVAVVNALHWFAAERAEQLLGEVHRALRGGGVFLLTEPASAETPFADRFEAWKSSQPPRYSQQNWLEFWSRANAILGYDHVQLLGSRDDDRIGDENSVADWCGLVEVAGFESIDVLQRDADQVIVAAVKSA